MVEQGLEVGFLANKDRKAKARSVGERLEH